MSSVAIPAYDNVAGNAYDKYHSGNPIARRLMQGFLRSFDDLVATAKPRTAFEFGCGEGYLSDRLLGAGIDVRGCDVDSAIVAQANQLSEARRLGQRFDVASIYDLSEGQIDADLILCCEVLEHLPDPEAALAKLAMQKSKYWLFSVPREPIWRMLNLARGKYVGALGNTPGHLQHWSAAGFRNSISQHFEIVHSRQPLPWTMVLCTLPKR